jgi:glycosyltransferase involved in cell wall biosynthesis
MNKGYILYLPAWYPHRFDTMFGLFVQRHAQISAKDSPVIVLYVFGFEGKIKNETSIKQSGNLIEYIHYYRKFSSGIKILDSALRLWQYFYYSFYLFKKIKAAHGLPRLAHVNILTRAGIVAFVLKKRFNIPYVITEHWSRYQPYPGTYRGLLRKWLTKLVVSNASALSTVTRNLYGVMSEFGLMNPNFMVINNVVDVHQFSPQSNRKENGHYKFINLTCFEDKSKNISGLIRSIEKLSKIRSDFLCYLVGEGQDWERLKKMSDDLGLTDKFIVFTGKLEGENLVNIFRECDFLVSSSHYENMPVVISEAFSCGLPVLSTDVGGIREHVNESNGLLIPKNDELALEYGLNQMLNSCRNFRTETIRDYALKNFSPGAVALQLENLYSFASSSNPQ